MPGAADTATIIAQIDKCPSGALSYIKNDAATSTAQEPTATAGAINIECLPNGPLRVTGEFIVKKPDGTEEIKKGPVSLCRCGASNNKPYCDGGHNRIGFQG